MLVESTDVDSAIDRLAKQLSSSGVKYEIKEATLLQEVPTKAEGLLN